MASAELDYSAPLTADKLSLIELSVGNHSSREDGLCVMEACAWLAGEPHSDAPQCACPAIRSYLIRINDSGQQWLRDELKLRIPLIVGTRGSVDLQKRRAKIFVTAAIKQAELVLPIFEAKFPNDDRPRKAIEAAKSGNAAYAAAYAARAAADAAYAAADAAARAAYAAAYAAADAADAAYAAYAAADAAADAAARAAYAATRAAADAAAYAAYAAARAAYAADADKAHWLISLAAIDEALALTEEAA